MKYYNNSMTFGLPREVKAALDPSPDKEIYYKANPDGTVTLSSKPFPLTYSEKIRFARRYLAENDTGVRFAQLGDVTVCTVPGFRDAGPTPVGIARRSPRDTFSLEIGKALALMRALSENPETIEKLTK